MGLDIVEFLGLVRVEGIKEGSILACPWTGHVERVFGSSFSNAAWPNENQEREQLAIGKSRRLAKNSFSKIRKCSFIRVL
jgi:hypothetical protein